MADVSPANPTPSVVAAEQRAREFLEHRQWRKARDELKPLVKIDRFRYLPLLLKANIGLSREMREKGLLAEAQQVLSYLATVASAEELRTAEQEMASAGQATLPDLGKTLSALANPALSLAERLKSADRLVLAFQPISADGSEQAKLAAELQAVHDGLSAVPMRDWERLSEVLRPVAHRSVFAHWSIFIKGLTAFHTGETERALRFLTSLPEGTAPAIASKAYLLFLGKSEPESKAAGEIGLEGACRLLGQPGAGRLLLSAERLWKEKGRHVDSYRVFRDALGGFPSQNLDWLGELTDFYFNADRALPEEARDAYGSYFRGLMAQHKAKNDVEAMLACRRLAMEQGDPADWEAFLRLYERLYGVNPRLSSVLHTHVGSLLSRMRSSSPYSSARSAPVNATGAKESLRKAIALDAENIEAHLALVELYKNVRMHRERNRLLDDMVVRFPEEKRVLLDAAERCLERKSYVKGLDYLDRARQLDQLDPRIPELIVTARRTLAVQSFQQRRPEKARQNLAVIQDLLTDKADDFQRGRWMARLRHAILEDVWGDADQARVLLAEARAGSPFPSAFLLFGHLAFRSYALVGADETPFWTELSVALKTNPALSQTALLLRILDHWRGESTRETRSEVQLLRKFLKTACDRPFTREEARQLVELKLDDGEWRADLRAVVKKTLRTDKSDPLFRLYEILLCRHSNYGPACSPAQLQPILREAGRRGDEATAQRIQQLLKSLEASQRMPLAPPMDFEDDEDDEDDEDWGAPPDFDSLLPNVPPGAMNELAEMFTHIADMSESEIQKLRATRPKDMPGEVFDMILVMARGNQLSGPKGLKGPRRRSPQNDDPFYLF